MAAANILAGLAGEPLLAGADPAVEHQALSYLTPAEYLASLGIDV